MDHGLYITQMTIFHQWKLKHVLVLTCMIVGSGVVTPLTAQASDTFAQDLSPTVLIRLQDFTQRAIALTDSAMAMLGVRYKYGGTTPESGLDCSGLVQHVFKQAWGKSLPRTAHEISQVGEKIGTAELQPGDLVFYNTLKRRFSHVGIYLGNNEFIHSPSVGSEVRIEKMNAIYWKTRFNGARRIHYDD